MSTARAIYDVWAMFYIGCGGIAASAIQYLFGGVLINAGFSPAWVKREERPRVFWLFIVVEAATGAALAIYAWYLLHNGG